MTVYKHYLTRLFLLGFMCYNYATFYLLYSSLPFPLWIALTQKIEGGFANNVYRIYPLNQQTYLLRESKEKVEPAVFAKMVEISTKATQAGLSPSLVACNLARQVVLLRVVLNK